MSNGRPSPDRSWEGRVAIHAGTEGFAYVPGEVLVLDRFDEALERARELFPSDEQIRIERLELQRRLLARLVAVPDVPAVVRHLRSFAIRAQPNHVFLAHCGSGCCCGPHPAVRGACGGPGADPVHGSPVYASPVYASPVYASPVYASPVYASPVYASPVYASPVYASPVYASPVYASTYVTTGFRRSSARPVTADEAAAVQARLDHIDGTKEAVLPDVVVLDTGLATDPALAPQALVDLGQLVLAQDGVLPVADVPDVNPADLLLDPAAGHGTFIAGLVEQVAPGATVELWRVLHPQGDGTEVDIAILIDGLPDRRGDGGAVLNLSFGGYVMDQAEVLATAIRLAQAKGYVVVASAGNDGVCRPTYPAALPDVVSVGAIGPGGPAPFSNYGPWVRACAPGVDLVSTFFRDFDGQETSTGPHDPDPDHFQSWARWSGTSFAAPIVAGALAQHARTFGVPVADAVTRVIDDPALLRIADLGTVVNLV
ncbi:MAG TPA: S8 family serine peptidase [Acidimicrobiales bacterium]|nr:S8 family serine peptidase [Acidimicrobiales bacterium]